MLRESRHWSAAAGHQGDAGGRGEEGNNVLFPKLNSTFSDTT